jgi:hypothetical protein
MSRLTEDTFFAEKLSKIMENFKFACSWASADFFPGEGKNFPGGARTYFLPKKQQ